MDYETEGQWCNYCEGMTDHRSKTCPNRPETSPSCHADCVIGNADHPGSTEYRCQDEDGKSLPFPGEDDDWRYADDGECHCFALSGPGECACGNYRNEQPRGREVSPNALALSILGWKVARIRDEIADWRTDDSEHSAAWDLAADLIARILDEDCAHAWIDRVPTGSKCLRCGVEAA